MKRPLCFFKNKSAPGAMALMLALASSVMHPATFPDGFSSTQVALGFAAPTAMAFSPDGRLFVCDQDGIVRVIRNDTLLTKPFLTVTVNSVFERGLLGIAFDPDFNTNQYVYIYYTAPSPAIHNRISRFTASSDTALAGSETIILDLDDLSTATNHNGGAIHFGPDGKLYAGVGENANGANAQTLGNLLGKILRINPDGTIPVDNPFYDTASGNNRAIWALGLRNPFTFAFQPGTTRMLINDVGQAAWEEINDGMAGFNYGWPQTEGFIAEPGLAGPVHAYGHENSDSTGCAIVGGAFYNPQVQQFPDSYVGEYFFADLCGGWIRVFHPADSTVRLFGTGLGLPVDLQVSSDGSLYYLDRGAGGVFKIVYLNGLPVQLVSFTGTVGEGSVLLSWMTLSEVNNYGFVVQRRRPNGQEYVEIPNSFVPGHGTTNEPHTYSFLHNAPGTGVWMYRLKQRDLDGSIHYSEPITIDLATGVQGGTVPITFSLKQNFPNPFNPATTIEFTLPQSGYTTLRVFDLLGKVVVSLVDGLADAGRHSVTWDASAFPSGVYFCKLTSHGSLATMKLVLMK